jgi:hypothetical protein
VAMRTEPVAPGARSTLTEEVPSDPGITVTLSPVINVTVTGAPCALPVAVDVTVGG